MDGSCDKCGLEHEEWAVCKDVVRSFIACLKAERMDTRERALLEVGEAAVKKERLLQQLLHGCGEHSKAEHIRLEDSVSDAQTELGKLCRAFDAKWPEVEK